MTPDDVSDVERLDIWPETAVLRVLQLWIKRTFCTRMPEPGKRPGECLQHSSQRHSPQPVSARTIAHMPTLKHNNKAAYTVGKLNNKTVKMLLDSGASCSVTIPIHLRSTNNIYQTSKCRWEKHHTTRNHSHDCDPR